MIHTTETDAPVGCALSTRSPAKINLTLDVLGRRPDGYHEIRSVVLGVDFCDDLCFEALGQPRVSLSCDRPDLPTDRRNLIVQAAEKLKLAASAPDRGVRITMSKRIPISAGLGSGSGNAAATLMALNRLWDTGISAVALASIGAEIGSDVPLFFALPAAVTSGRGEGVRPIDLRWSGWVVLVFAGCPVSTKDAYNQWSATKSASGARDRLDDIAGEIARARTAVELGRLCRNGLEPAVFRVAPAVRSLLNAVTACGATHARVTGAGQTVYVLFDDPEEAEVFRLKLKSSGVGTGAVVAKTLTAPWTI